MLPLKAKNKILFAKTAEKHDKWHRGQENQCNIMFIDVTKSRLEAERDREHWGKAGVQRWRGSFRFARKFRARCSGGLNNRGRDFATGPRPAPSSEHLRDRIVLGWAPGLLKCHRLCVCWEKAT